MGRKKKEIPDREKENLPVNGSDPSNKYPTVCIVKCFYKGILYYIGGKGPKLTEEAIKESKYFKKA